MKPRELYEFATSIADSTGTEARSRAIAHACYYAVYHLVAAHFHMNPKWYDGSRHSDVMRRLSGIVPRPGTSKLVYEAKRYYKTLYSLRVWADYDFSCAFTDEEADRSLQICEIIFRASTD